MTEESIVAMRDVLTRVMSSMQIEGKITKNTRKELKKRILDANTGAGGVGILLDLLPLEGDHDHDDHSANESMAPFVAVSAVNSGNRHKRVVGLTEYPTV